MRGGQPRKPTKFSTWGAVAFAGIGALPDTLASRSIIIPMRRRLPEQTVKSMRGANGLAELGKRLHQHTTSSAELMRAARPPMPGAAAWMRMRTTGCRC